MSQATARLVVQRAHNNNIVLAVDREGRSVVVTGAGVGFNARRGTPVDPGRIEAVFVPQDGASADTAASVLAHIPTEVVACSRRIVEAARTELGIDRPEVLLLPVADHLHQAVRRARQGVEIDIPLVWEVRSLYPQELAVGRRALGIVEQDLGVALPSAEATAFALHFVSSHFTGAVIDRTVRMTQLLTRIFDVVDGHRGQPLDRQGQAASRFVAHLRYLFVRLAEKRHQSVAPPLVREALEKSLPEVMAVADAIAALLAEEWDSAVSDDETTYIGLHVHRLLTEADGSDT